MKYIQKLIPFWKKIKRLRKSFVKEFYKESAVVALVLNRKRERKHFVKEFNKKYAGVILVLNQKKQNQS